MDIINAYGVSGREYKIRELIEDELKKMNLAYIVDNMGNVMVNIGSNDGEKFMICSHMDKRGIIVNFIEDDGKIRFGALGEYKPKEMKGQLVQFQNGCVGTIIMEKEDGDIDDSYIDASFKSREDALNLVREGETGEFRGAVYLQGEYVKAPSLDNRVGCYALIKALKDMNDEGQLTNIKANVTIAFTTQHHLGSRGAKNAVYSVAPDKCIVLDLENDEKIKLDDGILVRTMDLNLIMHHEMEELIETVCKSNNLEVKRIVSDMPSDGGIIQKEGKGCKTAVVSIPVKDLYKSEETVSMKDITKLISFIKNIVNI